LPCDSRAGVMEKIMMDEVAHYACQCKSCSNPMWLPIETLRQTFLLRAPPCTDEVSFGVVCPVCTQARNYSISKSSPDHGPKDSLAMGLPQKLTTFFVRSLRCDEESCSTPLLLFALWSDSTTSEDQRIDESGWKRGNDLHCPEHHRILVL